MKSRYGLIPKSTVAQAPDGTYYPDICLFPINKFNLTSNPKEHYVTDMEILRPDLIVWYEYEINEMDDLIFWLNGVSDPRNISVGDVLLLPSRQDLENFYYKNRV